MSRGVTSTSTSRLSDVAKEADKLSEEKAATFHSTMEKLLCIMKRSQPYIETDISFICTRVKDLDVRDWVKLRGVLQFLSQTIDDDPVIGD